MEVKFTGKQRNNLAELIGRPQLGGGTSLNDIEEGLDLLDKLRYDGDKLDEEHTIELSDKQVKKLYNTANGFNGWPIALWVKDMKDKLDEYNEKVNG